MLMEMMNKNRDTLVVLLLVCVCWVGFIDSYAEQYINDSIATSMVSFGVARLFNGTVSVLSTITLQVPLIGSIQIGELLDPLNDLVEDFSTIMKFSISSLLIQKLMVEILQTLHFKIFLTLSGVAFIISKFYYQSAHSQAYKLFVFALACKFSIALVAVASSWVDDAFLKDTIETQNHTLLSFPVTPEALNRQLDLTAEIKQQTEDRLEEEKRKSEKLSNDIFILEGNQAENDEYLLKIEQDIDALSKNKSLIENLINKSTEVKILEQRRRATLRKNLQIEGEIEDLHEALADTDDSILSLESRLADDDISTFQSLRDGFSNMAMAAQKKITNFVDTLNVAMENFINLMALFVFKTMVIPLLFLFGMYKVFQKIWNMDLREKLAMNKE